MCFADAGDNQRCTLAVSLCLPHPDDDNPSLSPSLSFPLSSLSWWQWQWQCLTLTITQLRQQLWRQCPHTPSFFPIHDDHNDHAPMHPMPVLRGTEAMVQHTSSCTLCHCLFNPSENWLWLGCVRDDYVSFLELSYRFSCTCHVITVQCNHKSCIMPPSHSSMYLHPASTSSHTIASVHSTTALYHVIVSCAILMCLHCCIASTLRLLLQWIEDLPTCPARPLPNSLSVLVDNTVKANLAFCLKQHFTIT